MDATGGEAGLTSLEPHQATQDDPVVAWRYWQVAPSGRLRSVTQRRIEWPPGQVMRAYCVIAGHAAPDERCDCGVHGSTSLDALREHGLCLAPEALVVGQVALWGRVVLDNEGWRAQYGRPLRLSVVRDVVSDDEVAAAVTGLAAYGVEVDTVALADAVAGVSAVTLANQAMAARASRTRAD